MYFRSFTDANSTLHVQKLGILTRYGTTTPTRSGEIVKLRSSSNIKKITTKCRN